MEQNTVDLTDPITAKFDDKEAMQRLVQQAVAEAVEKAQRMGFLPLPEAKNT